MIGCFPSYYFMAILPNACTHSMWKNQMLMSIPIQHQKSTRIQHVYHWTCLQQYRDNGVCALDLVMVVVQVEVWGLKGCNINIGDNDKRRHIMMMGGNDDDWGGVGGKRESWGKSWAYWETIIKKGLGVMIRMYKRKKWKWEMLKEWSKQRGRR